MNISSHITIAENFWDRINTSPKNVFHTVMVATKPDIIKQAPVYHALKKRGEEVILIHTGQHYDFNLSGGMLKEFDLDVDINLNISGAYYEKVAQIIERLGGVFSALKEKGKIPLPYIHGDTMTAMAVGNTAYSCNIACVHNEAGIRTLTPKKELYRELKKKWTSLASLTKGFPKAEDKDLSLSIDNCLKWWIALHSNKNNFERGSAEPIPEQFNTRCAEPASGIYLASHPMVTEFLVLEGFPEERIFVVGNSVVDATKEAVEKAKDSTIFEKYPLLKKGVVRFCIHRRENCENEIRFKAIFNALKKVVEAGIPTLLISLYATEVAIDRFGLREEMDELKKYENFLYSEVWPQYTDVIAAMQKAKAIVTDSGSMQEECNELGIPCITLRFGSDRGESFFAGGNILAPPMDSDFIFALVQKVIAENLLQNPEKIYGENVSEKCVDTVLKVLEKSENIFQMEEERIFG